MGFNSMAIGLLEKILTHSKQEVSSIAQIVNELRRDNISQIVSLDTSITTLTPINLNKLIEGGKIRSVSVLSVGGGLYLQTSIGDPFEVLKGDIIDKEEIEILRWYGAGAGTAILRITGLRI